MPAREPSNLVHEFQLAAGSIPGREHLGRGRVLIGRNNQDAWAVEVGPDHLVGLVCDGCGSGERSELGAQLGARCLCTELSRLMQMRPLPERPADVCAFVQRGLNESCRSLLDTIEALAHRLGGPREQLIRQSFLFTLLGFVVSPSGTVVFGLGDGVYWLNGREVRLGPYPDDAPPYLAYALLGQPAQVYRPRILECLPSRDLQSLLIGSDGVVDLAQASNRCLPGSKQSLGPVEQFWRQERFFRNSDALRRRLALANAQVTRLRSAGQGLRTDQGLLPDDTTLIVLRRSASFGGGS